ncbi:MAG: hypothetical protein IPJ14_02940 [Kineosporiaceae bacterium]|nr:hypothetical protein [Kineosporiaceae bacterium]
MTASLHALTVMDAADVARCGAYLDLVEALEQGHRESPPLVERLVFGPAGTSQTFMALPAWQPGEAIAAKLVTVVPDNPDARGIPAVQAVLVLFDGITGSPSALIDGTELTYRKTAADSALGSRLCSRPDAATLLMVGAGALAPHLIAAHRAVRGSIEHVLVWNRSPGRALALVEAGLADEVVEDLDGAVGRADIICTATSSRDPLIHGRFLQPGTHLDCVGAFLPDHREVDDEVVRRARIVVDSRPSTIAGSGDLVIPLAAGVIEPDDVLGDLYQLVQGEITGRTRPDQITLFENGGGGHLDLMVARHLVRRFTDQSQAPAPAPAPAPEEAQP